MSDTLPHSTRVIEYKLGWRGFTSSHRSAARPTHIVKSEHVKLGNDYHGKPIFTTNWNHKALCGVRVVPVDEQAGPETAACARCRKLYREQGES